MESISSWLWNHVITLQFGNTSHSFPFSMSFRVLSASSLVTVLTISDISLTFEANFSPSAEEVFPFLIAGPHFLWADSSVPDGQILIGLNIIHQLR